MLQTRLYLVKKSTKVTDYDKVVWSIPGWDATEIGVNITKFHCGVLIYRHRGREVATGKM